MVLLIGGTLSVLFTHWLNRPAAWRPAVIAPSDQPDEKIVALVPGREYEVTIEYMRNLPESEYRQLSAPRRQLLVRGQWSLSCNTSKIAGGDAADYLRIGQVRSWKGELYRILARVPFGVDETRYRSFGLAGAYLSERVIGAATVPADSDGNCAFAWQPAASIAGSRIALRRSESDWRTHSRRYTFLALGGLAIAGFGLLAGLIRPLSGCFDRQAHPPRTPR
jgi:hypothetical protein